MLIVIVDGFVNLIEDEIFFFSFFLEVVFNVMDGWLIGEFWLFCELG